MKPVFEKVPKRDWESFHCEIVRGPDYGTRWHFHPEFQITLAVRSSGHRVVGDNIAPLTDGDIVLIGANLPHVWHQDEGRGEVQAIIVRFDPQVLGADFFRLPELDSVRRLLERASRGLEVSGKTRAAVATHMKKLAEAEGFDRILELLSILHILATAKGEVRTLASAGYTPKLESADQGRMQRVCDFIHAHLMDEIDRAQLAKLAHLSEGAFSRFFSSRTGKTVPEYVNEVRIGRACRMLAEDAANITDIAMDCGYRNLANFNRRFRQVTGMTPSAYRARFRNAAGA
ncbi:MAG: AraC family transcriptional regulator [Verrucomicrobiaceae bacterium]|jgi:AraC-like DNA-binding protein|nr:AraC family transcriptional regulator [Verrucomicrobiaceae bacterium]